MMETSILIYSDMEKPDWSINNFLNSYYIHVLLEVLSLLLYVIETNIYQIFITYEALCWALSMYYLFNPHKNPVKWFYFYNQFTDGKIDGLKVTKHSS